jgi:hypothetical protein
VLGFVDGTARVCAMNVLLHGIGMPRGPSLARPMGSSRWVSRRRPMTCSGTTFGIDVTYTLTAP